MKNNDYIYVYSLSNDSMIFHRMILWLIHNEYISIYEMKFNEILFYNSRMNITIQRDSLIINSQIEIQSQIDWNFNSMKFQD